MPRFTTDTFNTGSIAAGASTVFNRTISANQINVGKIKVVPSGSTIGYTLAIFKKATALSVDKQFSTIDNVTGTLLVPTTRSGSEVLEGFIIPYEDLDATLKLHIKVTNRDAVARSYDVTVLYEVPTVFTGSVTFNDGTVTAPSIGFQSAPANGLYYAGAIRFAFGGVDQFFIASNSVGLNNDNGIFFLGVNADVKLNRDAPDVLALRRGANPQTFTVYNTFTDGTHFERIYLGWGSNIAYLASQSLGGTARKLRIQVAGVEAMEWDTSGHFKPVTDGILDLGDSTHQFRAGYFGTFVGVHSAKNTSSLILGTSASSWSAGDDNGRIMFYGSSQAHGFLSYRPIERQFYITGMTSAYDDAEIGLRINGGLTLGSDVKLIRDSANTLSMRNGVQPQTLQIWGDYESAGAFGTLLTIAATGGAVLIYTKSPGTTAIPLEFGVADTMYWQVKPTGSVGAYTPVSDNAVDLGTSALRVKIGYFANLNLSALPTSASGLPSGAVWNNSGVLNLA